MPFYCFVWRAGIGDLSRECGILIMIVHLLGVLNFLSQIKSSVQNNRLLTPNNVQCLFLLPREQARQKKKTHKTKTTRVLTQALQLFLDCDCRAL